MSEADGGGPDHDAFVRYVTETFPGVDAVTAMGATFFLRRSRPSSSRY